VITPETLAWLEKRGLNHPELVSHFRLGFAGALQSPHAKESKALRARLTALGVVRESTRQDHFRGCLVVPVCGWSDSTIHRAGAVCYSCTAAEP
jgi:DNA primase